MGVSTLLIARTDSESASLLDCNIDPRDQTFILGSTNPNQKSLVEVMRLHLNNDNHESNSVAENWLEEANLCTYSEAVRNALLKSGRSSDIGL